MKKGKIVQLGLIMALAFSMGVPSFASTITDAEKEKKELESGLEQVEKTIQDIKNNQGTLQSSIEQLDAQLNKVSNQLAKVESDMQAKEEELNNTKIELEQAKETEATQYDSMKKRIKFMYENGNTAYVEMVLESKSVSDFLNKADYVAKISEYDRNMLVEYQKTKESIAQKEQQLEQDYAALEQMKKEVEEDKASVTKLIQAKKEEMEAYKNDLKEAQQRADAYEAEIAEQEALIKQLEEAARKKREEEERKRKEEEERKKKEAESNSSSDTSSSSSTTTYTGGKFTWPCPASTTISSDYGNRWHPIYNAYKFHYGIDIAAASGSSIVAAYGGSVVASAYSSSMGNYVMLDHGDSLYTIYMHCSKLLVSEGQTVKAGQQIALVGSTGNSTGPHLHFGVRLNGAYVNPWSYLK